MGSGSDLVVTAKDNRPVPLEINGFGEEIVKALGVLVIRASHFDHSLASLLGSLAQVTGPQVWALFHYSVNAKARIDMITALAKTTDISDETEAAVLAILKQAKDLADDRNVFIHWQYSIQEYPNPGSAHKTVLVGNAPVRRVPYTVRPFTAEDIWALNERYRETRDQMATIARRVSDELAEA